MYSYITTVIKRGNLDELELCREFNTNNYDWTDAVIMAAKRGHLEMVKYIVEVCCDVDINGELECGTMNYPETQYVLRNTIKSGNLDLLEYVLSIGCCKQNENALQDAVQLMDIEMVSILCNHFKYTQRDLENALCSLTWYPYAESDCILAYPPNEQKCQKIVKFLISQGANVNCSLYPNSPGCKLTPLESTITNDNLHLAKILLRNGAELTDKIIDSAQGRCLVYVNLLNNIEKSQRKLYKSLLLQLTTKPPEGNFPGGCEYWSARQRAIDQGMI